MSAPSREQENLETALGELLHNLIEMGICASDVQESALEISPDGVAYGLPGGLMGRKAAQTVEQFAVVHELRETVRQVMIPIDVINLIDAGRNPHTYTRDFIDRVAGENMYTNGMLSAISDYGKILNEQASVFFPQLSEYFEIKQEIKEETTVPELHEIDDKSQVKLLNGATATNGTDSTGDVLMG